MQQKMLMEQQKQQQLKKIEDMKKAQEEMRQKQLQAAQLKQLELAKKRQEQASMMTIRRVIQKFRTATPENIAEMKQELETTLATDLPNCGAQMQRIQEEAVKGLQMAIDRVEKVAAVKAEAQQKLAEAARLREEAKKFAEELLKELESLVDEAEAAVKALKEKAEPLKDAGDMSMKLVEKTAKVVEEKGNLAQEKVKLAAEFVKENQAKIKIPKVPAIAKKEGEEPPLDTHAALAKAVARNAVCTQECNQTLTFAKTTVAKMAKKAEAKKKMDALNSGFDKFDRDKDGFLSKSEVKTYARTTHKFAVGEAAMAQIFKSLVEGDAKGVKKDDFQSLRVQVGIQRELAKDAERKKARVEKEARVEEMKKEVQGDIDAAAKVAQAAGELVDKVQAASKEVFPKAVKMDIAEIAKEADELEKLLEEAQGSMAKAKEALAGLLADVDEDIKPWMTLKQSEIRIKVTGFEQRLGKVTTSPSKLRDIATRKETAEMEALEAKALSFLRYHQKESKLSKDALFKAIDANKDGKISEAEFVKFFAVCKRPPRPKDPKAEGEGEEELETAPENEDLQKVFKSFDGDKEGFLTKEVFASVVRHLMKVMTVSAVLSKELKMDSEAVRKLDSREVVEVLEGPFEDEESKTKRVKVVALRDGLDGYVTVSGNGGTVFLRDGGRFFKVLRETPMTDKFELEEAPKEKPPEKPTETAKPAGPVSAPADDAGGRKLKAGEFVEVIEYPKKDEKSGNMRLKCKAKSDGHVGYATCQSSTGAVFMDAV
jgi:Ca2+-binding EF-hand superfamily protein